MDADGSPVSVVQLTFLKLLSATAHQRFTYSCQNSAAWLDEAAGNHGRSLRFLGASGEELAFNQTAAATIAVPYDGCRVRGARGCWPEQGGEAPAALVLTYCPVFPWAAPEGTDEDCAGAELLPSRVSASVGRGGL